jgi:hypothetical protein
MMHAEVRKKEGVREIQKTRKIQETSEHLT